MCSPRERTEKAGTNRNQWPVTYCALPIPCPPTSRSFLTRLVSRLRQGRVVVVRAGWYDTSLLRNSSLQRIGAPSFLPTWRSCPQFLVPFFPSRSCDLASLSLLPKELASFCLSLPARSSSSASTTPSTRMTWTQTSRRCLPSPPRPRYRRPTSRTRPGPIPSSFSHFPADLIITRHCRRRKFKGGTPLIGQQPQVHMLISRCCNRLPVSHSLAVCSTEASAWAFVTCSRDTGPVRRLDSRRRASTPSSLLPDLLRSRQRAACKAITPSMLERSRFRPSVPNLHE